MTGTSRFSRLFPNLEAVPPEHRLPGLVEQSTWLCGGELRGWDGAVQRVVSPVCVPSPDGPKRAVIGSYPMLGAEQALAALAAARAAWDHGRGAWPAMSVRRRLEHVEDFAARMARRRDEVVRLIMWEIGKTLPDARKEFDRTVAYIHDTVAAMKELDRASSRFEQNEGIIGQIRRSPLGVVLCMGPFNYPLNETFTTLIPALVMGNAVIFKPPKLGVLLHKPLLEDFRDAFPPGVVNTVYGDGETVVGPLLASGSLDVLAFIGTSRVADILRKQHPQPHRLRCVLGLEAKNAAIVLPDADLDGAVAECVAGALSFNGQRCTALKLIFVHRSLAAEFNRRLVVAVDALRPGLPWDPGAQVTPLPETGKAAYLAELVADALARGAQVLNPDGGAVHGTYFHPAVLYPVAAGMRVFHEEQFGPVVPVAVYDDVEEPVRAIRESPYGQQASLFGRDPAVVGRLVDQLVNQVCRVNVNAQCQRGPDAFPFTGRKDSAEGTLSVSDALRVFSIRTLAATRATAADKELFSRIVREGHGTFLSTDWLF
ncbi:MAG: NADP-dependent glyceraldehyde-3-phosphate dehydrogenase [bacterium]|nr:NADP-dependent glyceraldehyde-3-phosphate dehydrogenase [bacterium]